MQSLFSVCLKTDLVLHKRLAIRALPYRKRKYLLILVCLLTSCSTQKKLQRMPCRNYPTTVNSSQHQATFVQGGGQQVQFKIENLEKAKLRSDLPPSMAPDELGIGKVTTGIGLEALAVVLYAVVVLFVIVVVLAVILLIVAIAALAG
ncbi:MAG: hypothetical protein AAF518_04110 [Spirochaetota bacterium]